MPDTVSLRYSHRTILPIAFSEGRKHSGTFYSPFSTGCRPLPLPLRPLNTDQPRPVWISLPVAEGLPVAALMPPSIRWAQVMSAIEQIRGRERRSESNCISCHPTQRGHQGSNFAKHYNFSCAIFLGLPSSPRSLELIPRTRLGRGEGWRGKHGIIPPSAGGPV